MTGIRWRQRKWYQSLRHYDFVTGGDFKWMPRELNNNSFANAPAPASLGASLGSALVSDILRSRYRRIVMTSRLWSFLFVLSASLALVGTPARAHPHVWVTVKTDLVYAPDGRLVGIRHAWTFDDMYSSFALQGVAGQAKGAFTREELTPVVKDIVSSLREFDYFTFAKADGEKTSFDEPSDGWGEFRDEMLTVHFFLPLSASGKVETFNFEIFDPEFFIDFAFVQPNPVALEGAPADCKLAVTQRPDPAEPLQSQRLDDAMRRSEGNYGAMFANTIAISCR
jgi:ABC-type uncharacterized transport system substrate-binding protein